jgi:malonyl CoA-acyl carrier protein transacylase
MGMGEHLFDRFPEITEVADATLGYSIKSLCLENPGNQLTQTRYTQPALFTVNALTFLSAQEESGQSPNFVAGHSLGEYNALFAAGAFDFVTGLKLVQKRGELMSQATGGSMAAVIGLTSEQIRDVILLHGNTKVTIANLNAPQQTVISGSKEAVDAIKSSFEEAGARMFMPLKVSGAFHSRFMKPARMEFESYLKEFTFNQLSIPVISNVEALPYPSDAVADLLAQQITSPVRWVNLIQYLLSQPNPSFEEIGPGNILKGLLRQIRAGMTPIPQ